MRCWCGYLSGARCRLFAYCPSDATAIPKPHCLLLHLNPDWFHLTHTHTQPFNGLWSGTTRVGQYQKKHSPTHTHPGHWTSFINFLHLLRSIASSVFSLHAWQSSLTTSFQVLFDLPLGLGPSTSYSMHFFTQSYFFAAHAHCLPRLSRKRGR